MTCWTSCPISRPNVTSSSSRLRRLIRGRRMLCTFFYTVAVLWNQTHEVFLALQWGNIRNVEVVLCARSITLFFCHQNKFFTVELLFFGSLICENLSVMKEVTAERRMLAVVSGICYEHFLLDLSMQWQLWLIHTARKWDWDRYMEWEQE